MNTQHHALKNVKLFLVNVKFFFKNSVYIGDISKVIVASSKA